MESVRARAIDSLPHILLTLLSIIQALALEVLWSSAKDTPLLWVWGQAAIVGWLQVASVAAGIMLLWVMYTTMVMRLRWVPSTRDSVVPFVIGAGEFLMAELLGPEWLGAWLLTMAAVFLLSTRTSAHVVEQARAVPGNEEVFENADVRGPGSARSIAIAGTIAALGIGVWLIGGDGVLGVISVVLVLAGLVYQLAELDRWWRRSVEGG